MAAQINAGKTQRTKRSKVHQFSAEISINGIQKLKCNFCAMEFAVKGGNTTPMKNHLVMKHMNMPDVHAV